MKPSLIMTIFAVSLCLVLASPAAADTLLANFESFSEGFYPPPIFTDGAITFSDLDRRIPGEVGPLGFSIETTTSTEFGPLFSAPNYLNWGGVGPGEEGFSFTRFGSLRITFEQQPAASASLNVLSGFDATNVLTLNALRQGSIVGSTTIGFSSIVDWQTNTLSVSGVLFDELRLIASGPQHNGTVFMGIDNVRIETVSEPSTISLLSICFAALVLSTTLRFRSPRSRY